MNEETFSSVRLGLEWILECRYTVSCPSEKAHHHICYWWWLMVENNDFYINKFACRCLFMRDILNRSTLCSSSPNIRRNEEMMSMLFVNVQSIWNCTSYSFEYIANGMDHSFMMKRTKKLVRKKWKIASDYWIYEFQTCHNIVLRKITSLKEIFKTKIWSTSRPKIL